MKKLFLAAVSVCLLSSAIFCQETTDSAKTAENTAKVKFLLNRLNENTPEIQRLSLEIPYQERALLFKKEKKDALVPVAINVFSFLVGIPPNLGIGSFMQHDVAGGLIHLGSGVAGTLCVATGVLTVLSSKEPSAGIALLATGAVFYIGSSVFGIVRPITYASKYNRRLEQALLLNDAQMSIVPLVVPNGQFGLAVSVRY